jgi:hypothetical protein
VEPLGSGGSPEVLMELRRGYSARRGCLEENGEAEVNTAGCGTSDVDVQRHREEREEGCGGA